MKRLAALLPILLVLGLTSGCGGDGGGDGGGGDAQPAGDGAGFSSGEFDDLPRYPRSNPVSERTETDGVVARSFEVTGASPEQVLDWYRDNLAGWTVTEPPSSIGVGSVRGRWTRGDRTLVVSATSSPTPASAASDDVVTQYSLSLEPTG